ncbi:rod shape-determining protein [Streptacidiphilus cavernicola]|uniref:Rod shape-determining protein n=1 Tax=Streptacidiphilus cavernicola TaxID=3342716 RepID=A0ABV6W073_9ACTN
MARFRSSAAIDLGAATLRLRRGTDAPVSEMVARAVLDEDGSVFAMGDDALVMEGRTWGALRMCRPTAGGTVADQQVAQLMLRHMLRDTGRGRYSYGGRMGVCVSAAVTDLGVAALKQLCRDAGFTDVRLVPQALAAAVGSGIPVDTPYATVIVDLGAEHTSAALLVCGRVIASRSTRFGGDALDQLVARYLREVHQLVVSSAAAQQVKIALSRTRGDDGADGGVSSAGTVTLRGQNAATGRPRGLALPVEELHELLLPRAVAAVCDQVTAVLAGCPVEMSADIFDRGLVLTGGGAKLRGLADAIRAEVDLPVHFADECEHAAVLGTQRLMRDNWAGLDRAALRATTLSLTGAEPDVEVTAVEVAPEPV